jgi:hypothetical protein
VKNTQTMSLTRLCSYRSSGAFFIKSASLIAVLFLQSFFSLLYAQACDNVLKNNQIELKPAVCVNTVALLQGSLPTGGNGVYRYQWEENSDPNCGENGFKEINGATGKDYFVPTTANSNTCYRRVVYSGSCIDNSNRIRIESFLGLSPSPPTVTVTQPTCAAPTGTIKITSPAPAAGITYSIDGVSYTNTSGEFTGLAPKTYQVSVKYGEGCISPVKQETLNPLPAPTGQITPATGTLCGTGSTVSLSVSGGTSYQWYRDGVKLEGATAATYQATQTGTYTADIITATCSGKASNSSVSECRHVTHGSDHSSHRHPLRHGFNG